MMQFFYLIVGLSIWALASMSPASSDEAFRLNESNERPDAKSHLIDELKPPVAMSRKNPRYPWRTLHSGRDGWVLVAFTVEEDGSTENVRILDGFRASELERAVRSAVSTWAYEPGKRNGQAVDWHNQRVFIRFSIEGHVDRLSPLVVRKVRLAMDLLGKGKLSDAKKTLSRTNYAEALTLRDHALESYALARIEFEGGHVERAARNAWRAGIFFIPNSDDDPIREASDLIYDVLKTCMVVNVKAGSYRDALDCYNGFSQVDKEIEASLEKAHAQTTEILEGDQPFAARVVLDNGTYVEDLARNSFTIRKIEGALSNLEVRCDLGIGSVPVEVDLALRIPEAWNSCFAIASGELGTVIELVQYNQD